MLFPLQGILQRRRRLPSFLRDLAFGFGYPISENFLSTRGSLFQLPTLMGFPLQSFHPFQGSKEPLGSSFPLLRFLSKPFGFELALQRLAPLKKAVFLATQRINLGRRLCSLGSLAFQVFSRMNHEKNLLPFSRPLFSLFFPALTNQEAIGVQGLSFHPLGVSHKRRQPV